MSEEAIPRPPPSRAAERILWFAIYLVLVLAPLAFLAAGGTPEEGEDVFLAVAIGFVTITVLALQFVIPSRAAAFTAPFGIDRLIRFHRAVGVLLLFLVGAHVIAAVTGEDDYGSWLNPAAAPTAGRLGLVAAALLVVLVFTALWRRVMRIPYETWRGLHVVLGLGAVILAFGHVLAISRFTATGAIRWLTLGFVVAALVAAFYLRVGRQFVAARRPYPPRRGRPRGRRLGHADSRPAATRERRSSPGIRLAEARRVPVRAHRASVLLRLLGRRIPSGRRSRSSRPATSRARSGSSRRARGC